MDSHELAKKLLELPNEQILLISPEGSYDFIDNVYLCGCKSEIILEISKYE